MLYKFKIKKIVTNINKNKKNKKCNYLKNLPSLKNQIQKYAAEFVMGKKKTLPILL